METIANVKAVDKFKLTIEKTSQAIPQIVITQSQDGQNICKQIHEVEGNGFQEFFYVLFLNRANKVIGYYLASMGGMTGTVADPRLIIKAAALSNCTSIILCHNHPSGSIKPSTADEQLTTKIKEAAKYFDIRVLDHLIITQDSNYFSFADEGLI